jgi:hypothetical protein
VFAINYLCLCNKNPRIEIRGKAFGLCRKKLKKRIAAVNLANKISADLDFNLHAVFFFWLNVTPLKHL